MTIFTRVSAVSDTLLGHCSARSDFLHSSSRSLCGLVGGHDLTPLSRSYESCFGLN
jgi:hypothetical protein